MGYFGASLVVARQRVRAVWPSLLAVSRLWALARDPVPSRIITYKGAYFPSGWGEKRTTLSNLVSTSRPPSSLRT